MKGRRIYEQPEGGLLFEQPGDYGFVDAGNGEKWWYACLPNWGEGNPMARHGVCICGPGHHHATEHEDGTITISPSILWGPAQMPIYPDTWYHGWLERGEWREA